MNAAKFNNIRCSHYDHYVTTPFALAMKNGWETEIFEFELKTKID